MRLTTRRRYFVDEQVQGGLLLRAVAHWFVLLSGASVIMLVAYAVHQPDRTLAEHCQTVLARWGVVALATLVLLPLVLYDLVVVSNRFVGPVFRLRKALRALAAGQHVAPLQFRENDYWRGLADEFNGIAAYVDELKEQANTAERAAARDFQASASD